MNKFKKKFSIIFLLIFFYFFGVYLLNFESSFSNNFKNLFPNYFKEFLKKSVFYIPTKLREVEQSREKIINLDLKLRKLENEIDTLKSKMNAGKKSTILLSDKSSNSYKLEKIFLDYSLPIGSNKISKKNGYLEIFEDFILLGLWSGKIMYINKNYLNNEFVKINNLKTNIDDFLKFDDDKFISIKDLVIINGKLFISYTKVIKPETNCLNLSIIYADIFQEFGELNIGNFDEFFTYDECKEARFNGYQSGGRLFDYKDNNLLMTIGDFQNFTPAQDKNSFFGKIISINISNKKHRLISMGHRNPQGLLYDKKKNTILSTEHGQKGGDEVNLIIDNEKGKVSNYGWPVASYSDYYGYENSSIKKIAPFKKNHKKFGFIEPLIYFTPAIGISQIINSSVFKKKYSSDVFLVTSMREKKIIFLQIKQDSKEAEVIDELVIGERIRDIIILDKNRYLLYLEDSPSLGILSFQ